MMVQGYIAIVRNAFLLSCMLKHKATCRYIVHSHIFSIFALQCNCSWSSPYIVLMLCSCTYYCFGIVLVII